MAKKWPQKVIQRSFIKKHSFPNGLYNNYGLMKLFEASHNLKITEISTRYPCQL